MNGIYITEQGKKQLEGVIATLERDYFNCFGQQDESDKWYFDGSRTYLKFVLENSCVLPISDNFELAYENACQGKYKKGVIILNEK